ncbi:MAG: glycosyltransferase [Desulfomonile sp.]
MTGPRVTVLMSVYNGLTYLAEAVKSILEQSFSDFEFLVINDGSTEPLDTVLQDFDDARIVLLNHENIGLTRSLNRGLRLARGKYVARMDADDISLPGRLEAQIRAFEDDPHLDLVGCFFDVIDEQGYLIEKKKLIVDHIYRLWRLQFHNNYGHGSVMFRNKSILSAGGYDENLLYAQDFDLWSRISKRDNTKIIPQVYYQYRMIRQGSQSSVSHYETQLANAVRISNKSLKTCSPTLSETDCEEVRAAYWRFQRTNISVNGLSLLPETLEGFCGRFGIEGFDKSRLVRMVAADAIEELHRDRTLAAQDRTAMIKKFSRLYQLHGGIG